MANKGLKARVITKKQAREISGQLAKMNKEILSRLNAEYQKLFGTETSFQDWARSKFQTESRLRSGQTSFNDTSYNRKLKDLYVKAWKNKYALMRSQYQALSPGYQKGDWYKRKKRLKDRGEPAPGRSGGPGSKIKYTTQALMTGYLRESIEKGFRSGGNEHLKVYNLLLQGGFELDLDSFPTTGGGGSYPSYFVSFMIANGILEDEQDFVDLLPSDWDKIANLIVHIVDEGWGEGFEQVIESYNMRI